MVRVHPAVPTKHLKSLHYFHTDEWPLRRDLPIGSKEVPRVRRKATMCVRIDSLDTARRHRGVCVAPTARRRTAVTQASSASLAKVIARERRDDAQER